MALGIGFRREMADWDLESLPVDFYEVVPENWLRKSRQPLADLEKPVHFHGVSLNLGGDGPLNTEMLDSIRDAMKEIGCTVYSDHLSSAGDAHQLYDLFPIPFTLAEAKRVADRIQQAQDILGFRMGVENAAYYTNVGDMSELDFIKEVIERADCLLHLDTNNLVCNYKNHGNKFCALNRVNDLLALPHTGYCHIAGNDWSEQFGLYWDTHGAWPEEACLDLTVTTARDALLEFDNAIPEFNEFKEGLCKIRHSLNM
jgi:uncharacterized protein